MVAAAAAVEAGSLAPRADPWAEEEHRRDRDRVRPSVSGIGAARTTSHPVEICWSQTCEST